MDFTDFDIAEIEAKAATFNEWVFIYGLRVVGAILILVIGWAGARMIRRLAYKLMKRAKLDMILVSFLSNILYALIMAFVIIAALNKLGVQTASLIAVLGAAGLAIGLALQGSLSNFAAGVMIILFRHFKIGDSIEVVGQKGTVMEMNIFTTTLMTSTNDKVMVPNSSLTNGVLKNYTANSMRRVDHIIGVTYQEDMDKVHDALKVVVGADARVLKEPAPFIGVEKLSENSVDFAVQVWVKKQHYDAVKSELLEAMVRAFNKAAIRFPQPQRGIRLVDLEGDDAPEKKAGQVTKRPSAKNAKG